MTSPRAARERQWVRPAIVVITLALGWLVIRGAASALLLDGHPAIALRFRPASGDALAAEARARVVADGGTVDAAARALTRAALVRAPLTAAPLVLAGMAASADGDLNRAAALMRRAESVDPRSDDARYWLLDHDIRSGDYAGALGEVGPALRLRAGEREAIFALVAALLRVPGGFDAVRAALAADPDWRTAFFQTEAKKDPIALLSLLRVLPSPEDRAAALAEQRATLEAAITGGQTADAYDTWRNLAPVATQRHDGAIYDPQFAALPGAVPFNWAVAAGNLREPGALSLTFAGDVETVLAEQYAVLAPGAYLLAVEARGTGAAAGGRIAARVICAHDNAELATIRLAPSPAPGDLRGRLSVPANCLTVRVQFIGTPGDLNAAARARVTGIRLTRD